MDDNTINRRKFIRGTGIVASAGALTLFTPKTASAMTIEITPGQISGDATATFQQALNTVAGNGGGRVRVVSGAYKFSGSLTIPSNVTLEGEFIAPAVPNASLANAATLPASTLMDNGSTLMPTGTVAPFIKLAGSNSSVRGFIIYYPNQSATAPFAYPPTIQGGGGDNCSVQDMMLVNPWWGIDFETNTSGRHFIRGIYGQPLWVGISVDRCYDVGRISDIHFWPFWDAHVRQVNAGLNITRTPTLAYGLVLKRSDWQIVHNFFAYGYHVGIALYPSSHSDHPGVGANGQMSNINFDACNVGFDIYATQKYGVSVSNLNATAVPTSQYNQTVRRAIYAHNSDKIIGAFNVVNGSFWGNFNQIISWASGGPLQISNSYFNDSSSDPMIEITGGRAIIANNTFAEPTSRVAVNVTSTADRIVITGNQLTGNSLTINGTPQLRMVANNLA